MPRYRREMLLRGTYIRNTTKSTIGAISVQYHEYLVRESYLQFGLICLVSWATKNILYSKSCCLALHALKQFSFWHLDPVNKLTSCD